MLQELESPHPPSFPSLPSLQATESWVGPGNKASINKASINKASVNKASVNKASVNKANINKASINKASVNKANINKASVYNFQRLSSKNTKCLSWPPLWNDVPSTGIPWSVMLLCSQRGVSS